jgi:hypothetical protein
VTDPAGPEGLDLELTSRYGLLASALTGHDMVIRASRADSAWTDGRVITVDPDIDVRRQVLVQAALVRAGSLSPLVVREIVGRTNLTRRYLAMEGVRALRALTELMPRQATAWMSEVGVGVTTSPEDSLAVARSGAAVADPPPWFGTIRPRRVIATARHADARPETMALQQLPDAHDRPDQSAEADGAAPPASWLRKLFGDGPLARALGRTFGASGFEAAETGSGGTLNSASPGRARRSGVRVDAAVRMPLEAALGPRLHRYPEWDARLGRYRPDWCCVTDFVPRLGDLAALERSARHDGLRRELSLLGLGALRTRRRPGGFDLDLDAVVEARIAAVAGGVDRRDVYVDNLRLRRDLTVIVLLDASGSAGEVDPGGSELFRRQRDAAAGLVDTFAILGDRVAGYAFRSEGRDVAMMRFKDFDERCGHRQLARLAGVTPGGYTRIGAAIRHSTHVLGEDRATPFKLLLMLTDGHPYDHGYENLHAEADVRRALAEARAQGVACLAVNLGSATDDALLSRVFGPALHVTAPDIDALVPTISRLVRSALESAQVPARTRELAS